MARSSASSDPTSALAPSGPGAKGEEYLVVARRYRPQTFTELIGQEHISKALSNAISTQRVGHAYLFTGARGVGKTSAARILAKALNCEQGSTPTPCNQCDMCLSISAGSDVDVLEIDGASNRGIDEIRQLRQNVNIRPSRARFKVYIIDEVHMLTREAFNALLKTLEEPPEHVKFIFCTTEANKIPITILSRCQRFDFAGIRKPSIVERLSQIVAAEGATAEPEALEIIARRANGSMRDSQSLLEQLLSFGGKNLTAAQVHELLGTAGEIRLASLLAALAARDPAAALKELDTAVSEGVDVGQLLEQLLGSLRDAMAVAVGCSAENLLFTSSSQAEGLTAISKQLGLESILALSQLIDHTLGRMRTSTQARTLAELALVRMCSLGSLEELAQLVAELRSGESTVSGMSSAGAGQGSAAQRPMERPAPAYGSGQAYGAGQGGTSAPGPASSSPAELKKNAPDLGGAGQGDEPQVDTPDPIPLTSESVQAVWDQALARLGVDLIVGYAEGASVANPAPNRLVVSFPARYTFQKTQFERPENVAKLEKVLRLVAGGPVRVEFAVAQESPAEPSPSPAKPAAARRLPEADVHENPLVRRAVEKLGAQVRHVEQPKA